MYKLFLCLRYLRRRYIALVAIIGMALCVFMVLVVVSVMNGFLGLIENAAKGMMGDVIVDAAGGIARYERFIAAARQLDDVEAATPVIYSPGLLRIGPSYTQPVHVVGVDPNTAVGVSSFATSLFPAQPTGRLRFQAQNEFLRNLDRQAVEAIARIDAHREQIQAQLNLEKASDPTAQDADSIAALQAELDRLARRARGVRRLYSADPNLPGIILGVDIPGTTDRDRRTGRYKRYLSVGQKMQLTLIPFGRGVTAITEPVKRTLTLAGDSRMGIFQIDSRYVYVDFAWLQRQVDMHAVTDPDSGRQDPARCSQIQIKAAGQTSETDLRAVAHSLRTVWDDLAVRFPDMTSDMANVSILTWREKQADYIGPIEKQRTLVTIMFAIISLVAVVLVFAIFYMMVVQKTKDIGVLKSIGASSGGVAGIYLLYGSAVGLVGSVIGAVGGYLFVRNINPIHDWVADTFGWQVFDRKAYLFDQIPDTVQPGVIGGIVIGAILAGLLGAVLPAMRAATMQPVEALRYE